MEMSACEPASYSGIPVDTLFRIIEKVSGIKRFAVISRSRKRELSWIRFLIMYLLKSYTKLSLSEIGAVVLRNHATAVNGIRCMSNEFSAKSKVQITPNINIIELYRIILNNLAI